MGQQQQANGTQANGNHQQGAQKSGSDQLADMVRQLAELKAQNEALAAALKSKPQSHVMKVSPKGALQISGFGRWPITHYKDTWYTVLAMADDIKAFLKAHDAELKGRE